MARNLERSARPLLRVHARNRVTHRAGQSTRAGKGLSRRPDGYKEVYDEIVGNYLEMGSRAGIADEDVQALIQAEARMFLFEERLDAARVLVATLERNQALLDEHIQELIDSMAVLVESRARATGNGELLRRYTKTRTYRPAMAGGDAPAPAGAIASSGANRWRNASDPEQDPHEDRDGEPGEFRITAAAS